MGECLGVYFVGPSFCQGTYGNTVPTLVGGVDANNYTSKATSIDFKMVVTPGAGLSSSYRANWTLNLDKWMGSGSVGTAGSWVSQYKTTGYTTKSSPSTRSFPRKNFSNGTYRVRVKVDGDSKAFTTGTFNLRT